MNKPVNQIEAAIEKHFGKENLDEQEQYEAEIEEQYNNGYQKGYAEGLKDGKLEGHLEIQAIKNSMKEKLSFLTKSLKDKLTEYENKDNH